MKRVFLTGCLALLVVAAPRAPVNDLLAIGEHGVVVSADPLASQAGLDVLRQGGNAVDAAVTVALTLAVVHPQAGNLGGGGFMVVRMADGRSAAIDFRETAPSGADRGMYLGADGKVLADKSLVGASAAGVPGTPAGVAKALELFGSKPLAKLAQPAIRLARDGFTVQHFLAGALRDNAGLLRRFPSSRAVFFRDGRPLEAGDRLVQEDLARTLERFAGGGVAGFYEGETATRVVAQMQHEAEGGWRGLVSLDDLRDYRAKVRDVLRGSYRGLDILAMPPPSSGGVALLEMLNILEPYDIAGSGFGSSKTIHLMTEAMRRAYADRARWLGDMDFYPVPLQALTSKEYATERRKTMRSDRVSEVDAGVPPGAEEGEHTTHFSIVDGAGNAVACTTTINSWFGSGLVVEGAGFLLNNEMDDFSVKPGVPNQFGLVGGKANAIEPGKRMLSSMTPTIVVQDGKVRFVLGSPGGGRIINAVLQVLLNVVDHGMPLQAAVEAPRIHHQWKPDTLFYERFILSEDVRARLAAMGHKFADGSSAIGRCQCIEVARDGRRIGMADPRSGGAAAAW